MAINSRKKGKEGELEACHTLAALFGWAAERSQQYCGRGGDDDVQVAQTPSLFWEIKRQENLNVHKAMQRASEDAGRRCPVLMHRKNRSEWLLTIRLADLPRLCHAYQSASDDSVASPPLPHPDSGHRPRGPVTAGDARRLPDR